MSLRWRADGTLVCAAKTQPEADDTYIDDRLHYQLSIISRAIIPDTHEDENGLWHWVHGDALLRAQREEAP